MPKPLKAQGFRLSHRTTQKSAAGIDRANLRLSRRATVAVLAVAVAVGTVTVGVSVRSGVMMRFVLGSPQLLFDGTAGQDEYLADAFAHPLGLRGERSAGVSSRYFDAA